MPQNYTEIASTQTIITSLPKLLDNDKTLMSNSSGVAFPTANLQVGMFCFRTDLAALYQLKDLAPSWVKVLDLTASFDSYAAGLRAQATISGGGNTTYTTTGHFNWSQRFILMGAGRGTHFSVDGFFNIDRPAAGATIVGVGGPNVVVTSAGIPMALWDTLCYIPPVGQSSASVPGNFRIVNSFGTNFVIPAHWVTIATVNGDTNTLYMATGGSLRSGESFNAYSASSALAPATDALSASTTAGRPAATLGRVRFDTDLGYPVVGDGSNWESLAPPFLYGRNRLINGDFLIDQRPNSGSLKSVSAGASAFAVDRWRVFANGASAGYQRVFANGAALLRLSGAAGLSTLTLTQYIEAINVADLVGKQVTLSATISSTSLTSIKAQYAIPDSWDSWGGPSTFDIGTLAINATPTRYVWTFTVPPGATNGLAVNLTAASFTTGTLDIKNVQLEEGPIASSFERISAADVIARCQRYYYRDGFSMFRFCGAAGNWSAGAIFAPQSMRVTPNALLTNLSYGGSASGAIALMDSSRMARVRVGTTGGGEMSVTGIIELDAEL